MDWLSKSQKKRLKLNYRNLVLMLKLMLISVVKNIITLMRKPSKDANPGKFVELAGRRCKIERWRSKGSPEAIQGYLKYLLVDHFSADQHLQDMVKKHRKWVPISINSGGRGGRREGLLTFNRARHYRINANDVRNFITQMGGKVSDNGDFITSYFIEEWY